MPKRSRLYRFILLVCFLACFTSNASAGEPRWHYAWEKALIDWVKSLKTDDVHIDLVPVDPAKLDPAMARRDTLLYAAYAPPMTTASGLVKLPDKSFLWTEIWKEELPLLQEVLKEGSMNLRSGQIWIPATPVSANHLAWLYSWNETWNPYYYNRAVAIRASVISIIDLVMRGEEYFYYNSGKSDFDGDWRLPGDDNYSNYTHLMINASVGGQKKGRKFMAAYAPGSGNIYTPFLGFAMMFNGFTLLHVRDMLPDNVKNAWDEGLAFLLSKLASSKPGQGPANMELSLPCAFYYGYLATGNRVLGKYAEDWADKIVYAGRFSPAGHYKDGQGPDGSYNGIALHEVARLWSIAHWAELTEHLRKCYRLKGLMTLVEPDDAWLSPSHFNERTPQSFADDQHGGREVQFAVDVPEAAPFLRRSWPEKIDPDKVAEIVVKASKEGNSEGAVMYAKQAMHGWGAVLSLPYFMYHQDITELDQVARKGQALPIKGNASFIENLHNEFICVKRPNYYVILYAGPISGSDNGATNYRGAVEGQGGRFNGFAGGGISAFWTPAGTMLLGRLSGYESYVRKIHKTPWGTYNIPGWQDWANNHIIGETENGKILTSARTSSLECVLDRENSELIIKGDIATKLRRQGVMLGNGKYNLSYQRNYVFKEDQVEVKVNVFSRDIQARMKSLYETLPVYLSHDMGISFLDTKYRQIDTQNRKHIDDVKKIVLQRSGGSVDIVFNTPTGVALISETLASGALSCRSIHIEFPETLLVPKGKPATLSYTIVPNIKHQNVKVETGGRNAVVKQEPPVTQPYRTVPMAEKQSVKEKSEREVVVAKEVTLKKGLSSVYTNRDSNVFHKENCFHLYTGEALVNYGSPQDANEAGCLPCNYCFP